jgi:hypothetical protein
VQLASYLTFGEIEAKPFLSVFAVLGYASLCLLILAAILSLASLSSISPSLAISPKVR